MLSENNKTVDWWRFGSLAVLAGATFWVFWPVISAMQERWSHDPRYAHGYLVPIFSLSLLWMRRKQLTVDELRPSKHGLSFLVIGVAILLLGGYFRQESIEGIAFLLYLAGIILLVGGWAALKWAWPSIGFLFFMIPLPWRLENAMGPPLQWLATKASTFALQTAGFMAFDEGNVIQLSEGRIGVVEACSGLSMVITFIALSVGLAMVVERPVLDRIMLVFSAIPVALLANIARITLTGVLHETVSGSIADHFYHDLAGWVMIPFAMLLYWCEIWMLTHILNDTEAVPVPVGLAHNEHSRVQAPALAMVRKRL